MLDHLKEQHNRSLCLSITADNGSENFKLTISVVLFSSIHWTRPSRAKFWTSRNNTVPVETRFVVWLWPLLTPRWDRTTWNSTIPPNSTRTRWTWLSSASSVCWTRRVRRSSIRSRDVVPPVFELSSSLATTKWVVLLYWIPFCILAGLEYLLLCLCRVLEG